MYEIEVATLLLSLGAFYFVWKMYFSKPVQKPPIVQRPLAPEPTEQKDALLPMKILFGSQSGTAETFSEELAEEAKTYGFAAKVVDLEDYDPDDIGDEKCLVFLLATFGEGEPTDNAVSFYEWVMKTDAREQGYAKDVPYAVFALGNRQYEHFCNVGRNVDNNLHKFGGIRLCPHGEGDDDGNLSEDYSEWKITFWTAVRQHFGIKGEVNLDDMAFNPACTFKIVAECLEDTNAPKYDTQAALVKDPKTTAYWAEVDTVRELRQDCKDGGSTIHMEVSLESTPRLKYVTADNLGIHPRNEPQLAAKLIDRFNAKPTMLFSLRKTNDLSKFLFPTPCSVKDAFEWYVDFNSTPRAKILKLLANYTEDATEKAQLMAFATTEKEKFGVDQMSLFELFFEFPSINIPLSHFLELCPKITPRLYTISSSSKANPRRLSITSSLVLEPKPRNREFKGLCTSYLTTLKPKDKICVSVRPSGFRLPSVAKLPTTPIIMVGPGTGVAPFKGFLQEFAFLKMQEPSVDVESYLYFGCKNAQKDFIYEQELQEALRTGVLKNLSVAFSRDQEAKIYVQHRIREDTEKIWHLLEEKKANFYVCGATSMGRSVREALMLVAMEAGGKTEPEAKKYIETMTTKGRYIQELWS
jgi:NADPH-ferrihemoprotein reductase